MHHGNSCQFVGLASFAKSFIQALAGKIVPHGAPGAHVQQPPHFGGTVFGDAALFFDTLAGIVAVRCDPEKFRHLIVVVKFFQAIGHKQDCLRRFVADADHRSPKFF